MTLFTLHLLIWFIVAINMFISAALRSIQTEHNTNFKGSVMHIFHTSIHWILLKQRLIHIGWQCFRFNPKFKSVGDFDIKNMHTVCWTALCPSPRPPVRQKRAAFQDLLSHLIFISVTGLKGQQSGPTLPCLADHHQSESAGTKVWS